MTCDKRLIVEFEVFKGLEETVEGFEGLELLPAVPFPVLIAG